MDGQRFDRLTQALGGAATRRGAVRAAAGGAALAGLGAFRGRAAAQGATPAGGACPAATPEANKALVERYWAEVWTAGGEARVAELLAPDEAHHWGIGADTVGREAFAERLRAFLAAFPDVAVAVDQLVAEGDAVVSRWTARATHEGEWLGVAATGASVEWTGVNVFRVACGRIAESWGKADHLGLLRQIGGAPGVATPAA
jgi:steroid delta-isomerase-like uncharacterized protein